MRMSRRFALYAVGGGAFTQDSFTYTGLHEWIDDGDGNFRLKFKGSGIFTPLKKIEIDVFLVGAGGGGREGGYGGGGGGYTATYKNIILDKGTPYEIKIGGGGLNLDGEASSAFGKSANGGKHAVYNTDVDLRVGGDGGSGGGGYGYSSNNGGKGGSDGSDGAKARAAGGKGQGLTTREFGEDGATLYAGGGGGASYGSKTAGAGGGGGGGKGGHASDGGQTGGTENTGGGGGSGSGKTKGGSGIVIIRNARTA